MRDRTVVGLKIRPAQASDLSSVVELYNHYVRNSPATFEVVPVTAEDRSGWLAEHSTGGPHRLLVAEGSGGGLVGWATTGPFRPRAAYATTVESSVYCRPDAVGQGIGTQLYDALFRAIEREDVERVVAGVALPNPASVALHRKFGFRHVGTFTRVGRKFGRYWDVAWFERPLRPPSAWAPGRVPQEAPPGARGSTTRGDAGASGSR